MATGNYGWKEGVNFDYIKYLCTEIHLANFFSLFNIEFLVLI